MASDLRKLVKLARSHGFTAELSKGGHWVFYNEDGERVATTSSTPSDRRSQKNIEARLRAAGLPVPHKGGRVKKKRERTNQ